MNLPLWFSNLVFWSAQVAVLAVAAAILIRVLRIREPRMLLVLWRALLAISLLLPVLQPWHREKILGAISAVPNLTIPQAVSATSPAAPHSPFLTWTIAAEILGLVIVLGIALRLAIFIVGLIKLGQLRQSSSAIPAGACAGVVERTCTLVGARAEFRVSAEVHSPVTFGLGAPLILLPERFLTLDEQSRAAIACHELLHVRRRDWAHHLIEEIVRVVLWFHPAILWVVARVRLAREQVVDLEVVRLTEARKAYLEALVEFASSRAPVAAIPAPPFLAERQLVERVSLMLKEVRMSRRKLIVSLSAIVCTLALAAIFAVSVFPLKASPRLQYLPQAAASPAVSSLASRPVVDASAIRIGQVRRRTLSVQVPAVGTLIPDGYSGRLMAEVLVSGDVAHEVQLNQRALVDVDRGKALATGHVANIGPADSNGNRWFDLVLDSTLPQGIRANTSVKGFIDTGKVENALYIDRPAGAFYGPGVFEAPMFKLTDNGKQGVRVQVSYTPSNAVAVQVLSGLNEGDIVILSDMFPYQRFTQLQISGATDLAPFAQ